ncbi:MAG TPA: YitT family protein, partial [Limnochordia bacterium]
ITQDLLLATVFGGVILGLGVGIVVRNGGSSDGTEILALVAGKKFAFSVGEIVMFLNIFILGSAGLVFGWDRAMYSLIAYFIAFKTIDAVIVGFDESKSVTIISKKYAEIEDVIINRLGRTVTRLHGQRGYSKEETDVLLCIVTRLELSKLKSIIAEQDPNAFVAIENVHDVLGGRFGKRSIH